MDRMVTNKGSQIKDIKISPKLHTYLKERGSKTETFEDIIWRLIGQKQITQEDSKELPPEYSEKLNTPKVRRR